MATKYEDYTVEELRNELRSIMSDPNPLCEEIVPLTEEEMQRLDQIMTVLNAKDPLPKAWQKILCKRYSTKSRMALWKQGGIWLKALADQPPGGRCGMRAAGVNAAAARREN